MSTSDYHGRHVEPETMSVETPMASTPSTTNRWRDGVRRALLRQRSRDSNQLTSVIKEKSLLRMEEIAQQERGSSRGSPSIEDAVSHVTSMKFSRRAILKHMLLEPLNVLLLSAPLAVVLWIIDASKVWIFCTSFVAIVPLAKLLGDATEQLADALGNDTLGGLLNATFGNAVEVMLSIMVLLHGEIDVVKNTLLGSMLSNLLLVLGMSFFAGGIGVKKRTGQSEQSFDKTGPGLNVTMLVLASMAFSIPTIYLHSFSGVSSAGHILDKELSFSRITAVMLACGYAAFLCFSLITNVEMFANEGEDEEEVQEERIADTVASHTLPISWSLSVLVLVTCAVAFLSELLSGSIEGLVESWHCPKAFVGMILLPIVGNAAEHTSAIRFCLKDKPQIAIEIAVGSTTQIALFVTPVTVMVGWMAGQAMDLSLGSEGICVLFMAVLLVFTIVNNGKSNWLEGFMLMVAYFMVAVLYWQTPSGEDVMTTSAPIGVVL